MNIVRVPRLEWSEGAAGPVVGYEPMPLDERAVRRIFGPGVEAGQLAWMDRARCAEVDPDLHFPEKGESTGAAKRVCRGCEVRGECLAYALEHSERFGVWGGLSEMERRRLKKEAA